MSTIVLCFPVAVLDFAVSLVCPMEKYYPSKPRLDLSHGFYQQIRQNQFIRAQDEHDGEIDGLYAGQEIARGKTYCSTYHSGKAFY